MRKINKKIISALLCLCLVLSSIGVVFANDVSVETGSDEPVIKNIIYMIPDGGGMAPFYLTDAVKQAGGFESSLYPNATPVEKGEMSIKPYLVGAETVYAADIYPSTDSAAAGTALATGYKTNGAYIGVDPNARPHANILEACQDLGKNTGIVVTYEWTNATPATFSAHDISRYNATTMSEQIVNQGIDVVFGATNKAFSKEKWFTDSALAQRGYTVIKDKATLENVKPGDRVWGKLPNAFYDVEREATTPNLAELTEAAITALDDGNENGFFLMVEGSAVDGGAHANDAVLTVSEYLAFDAACKVAIEYAKSRTDTIVLIAPDHDTGGLSYNPSDLPSIVSDIQQGINPTAISWSTKGHSGRNGGIFIYLPEGVPYPEGIDISKKEQVASEFYNGHVELSGEYPQDAVNVIDNTDIPKYLASLINADLDALTKKLFVDVTDLGTYDATTETFTFSGIDISVKRNASTASVLGQNVSLDGEIAVYIEGRFYVPQKIFALIAEIGTDFEIIDGTVLYANYETGEISLVGDVGVSNVPVSVLVTKPGSALNNNMSGNEIAALGVVKSDQNGYYAFNSTIGRIAGKYVIHSNYSNSTSKAAARSFALENNIPELKVTSNSVSVSDMSQLKTGDVLDITLSGFGLESDYPGVVIAAQYVSGKLLYAEYIPAEGASVYFGDKIEKKVSVGLGADEIKIFYLNKNTCMPLIASYTID